MDGISIIVPFLNEEDGIAIFMDKLDQHQTRVHFPIELVFVDDGSSDETCKIIRSHYFRNIKDVKLVRLSRNFGSHAAIRAGLPYAKYDVCTWMGSDLQEPLEFLQMAYDRIHMGLDAVYVEKKHVEVSMANRMLSKTYSRLMQKYVVRSYGSGGISNIVFNSKIKEMLINNEEKNSSIMLQIMQAGFQFEMLSLEYGARTAGVSKWTIKKKIRLFVDSFVSFTNAPLRLVTFIGIILFLLGTVFGLVVIVQRLANPNAATSGYATLACLISMGFGITNISLGIISEYLWRTFDAARRQKPYFITSLETLCQSGEKDNVKVI